MKKSKKNFVNREDLLKEIHKSKMSYCYYVDETASIAVDAFVKDPDRVKNRNEIALAKKTRAKRLCKAIYNLTLEEWSRLLECRNDGEVKEIAKNLKKKSREILRFPLPEKYTEMVEKSFVYLPKGSHKPKLSSCEIDADSIPVGHLVFRVMTNEHVPMNEKTGRKEKCQYLLPFKHYKIKDGEPMEVLRSHWKGGFSNGKFCEDHGKMTDNLAKMIVLMCNRYAMGPQWSGYTYNDDMKGAAAMQLYLAGLKFDESSNPENPNPFAYYTTVMRNSFLAVMDKEKRQAKVRETVGIEEITKEPHVDDKLNFQKKAEAEEIANFEREMQG